MAHHSPWYASSVAMSINPVQLFAGVSLMVSGLGALTLMSGLGDSLTWKRRKWITLRTCAEKVQMKGVVEWQAEELRVHPFY